MAEHYFTINIPIHPEVNRSKLERLEKIQHRDYQVLKYGCKMMEPYLGSKKSIRYEEISERLLTSQTKSIAPFNIKKQFTGFTREFQEIINNLKEIINSYLSKKGDYPYTHSTFDYTTRRMNYERLVNGKRKTGTCRIIKNDIITNLTSAWIQIYDPFNDETSPSKRHLKLPLKVGDGLKELMKKRGVTFNDIRSVVISKNIVHLTFSLKSNPSTININPVVRITTGHSSIIGCNFPIPQSKGRNKTAILSIDQGIRQRLTGVWLLPNTKFKQEHIRYYAVPEYQTILHSTYKEISKRQSKLDEIKNQVYSKPFAPISKLKKALTHSRNRWDTIMKTIDSFLIQAILVEVLQWQAMGWKVKVVIGYPKNVNEKVSLLKSRKARRQSGKWNYYNFIKQAERIFLKNNLKGIINEIEESYTSKTCSNCGATEFIRYNGKNFQQLQKTYGVIFRHGGWFECFKCGYKINADVNGAINIGRAFIITSLYKIPEQERVVLQRRRDYWHFDRLFKNRMKRNKNAKKKEYEEWNFIKKKPKHSLKPLLWLRHSTNHVAKAWKYWMKIPSVPRPVP